MLSLVLQSLTHVRMKKHNFQQKQSSKYAAFHLSAQQVIEQCLSEMCQFLRDCTEAGTSIFNSRRVLQGRVQWAKNLRANDTMPVAVSSEDSPLSLQTPSWSTKGAYSSKDVASSPSSTQQVSHFLIITISCTRTCSKSVFIMVRTTINTEFF